MEYEYLFAMTLHQKIRERVIGKVFCKITYDDRLFIKIETYENLIFRMYVNNFSERILNGWSTDYAMYEVINEYKKFILARYFN